MTMINVTADMLELCLPSDAFAWWHENRSEECKKRQEEKK